MGGRSALKKKNIWDASGGCACASAFQPGAAYASAPEKKGPGGWKFKWVTRWNRGPVVCV